MYLNPPSFSYQRASWSHVFTSYPDPTMSSKLHPSINGFFQCFPYAPKLLLTHRLDEVSVWAKNLSKMCRQGGRSREKLQRNGVDDYGYTISNSQMCSQGFLSQKFIGKTPYNFVGIESLYMIGKGMRQTHFKKLQVVSFVGHSRLGLSHEVTRKIQHETLQILACASHVALRASCELVVKSSSSQIFTKLSHTTLTFNHTKKYKEMIEQKYN